MQTIHHHKSKSKHPPTQSPNAQHKIIAVTIPILSLPYPTPYHTAPPDYKTTHTYKPAKGTRRATTMLQARVEWEGDMDKQAQNEDAGVWYGRV